MSLILSAAEEEALDIRDPLRHLRDDYAVVPVQPPSVLNQNIQLSFPRSREPLVVQLFVDASPGCGGVAWPAGEVLGKYLARRDSLAGKRVIELGSGTGLVGLIAAHLGATVWITDQSPLLEIMKHNVALNSLTASVSVLELNWGCPLPTGLPERPDLILAADCVYFEPAFPLLVKTLSDLVSDDMPEVLFCYKKRRKADKRFFALLKKHFDWSQVDDDPDYASYTRESISLLRLVKKKQV